MEPNLGSYKIQENNVDKFQRQATTFKKRGWKILQ